MAKDLHAEGPLVTQDLHARAMVLGLTVLMGFRGFMALGIYGV